MLRLFWNVIEWLGGHELVVLVALLVVVAGTWAFIALAGEVIEGDTQGFDERLVLAMRQANDPAKPIGPAWTQEVGRDLTALGGVAVLMLVTLAVTGYLFLAGRYRMTAFVLAATLGGLAVSSLLKSAFDRPRPSVVPHLSQVYTSSFPSGHSMMSAVVYLTLGALLAQIADRRRLKFYALAVAVLLAVLVGVSRVYMGVHYPTDVLAGWTAGLVWATLCWLTLRAGRRRGVMKDNGASGPAR
jgi:undecaprenyl-diphosphatase